MFLELQNIHGDSKIKANAIDIESWSFGATQTGTAHRNTGGGAGKVNVQDVHVMKMADKASPTLLKKCCEGEHIKKGKITCRKAGGKKPVDYFVLEMEDIIITSLQNSGSNGADLVTESLSLSFGMFKQIFTEQKADGSDGPKTEHGWNVVENKTH
jgi:type VI secretion system secreted protein Hcp